ncbi:MAG TPA: coenzyme F420-0:L-glutamate ligase [Patescibacteria group bacterium]|nr:coenzyme F420-0:L-glutamate ligase [Patescibacteria group bacterium]
MDDGVTQLKVNPGKELSIIVADQTYERWPIKTHVVTENDDIVLLVEEYVQPYLQAGDFIFVSEKIVAISQGRAFRIKDIQPSRLANFLVRFVHKSPYGIGLGSPWTMELALREAGVLRILFAAFISAITKPFGLRGIFYHLAGKNVNAIDGPCSYTLPPYNEYAKLGPLDPDGVAKRIKERLGAEVVIIDSNDLGVNVLGRSADFLTNDFCQKLFADNPLGQASEQTPICLVRMRR